MGSDPVLVLQLHRMGDLILTFPLLRQLQKIWPGHPIHVVAEPNFFTGLTPFAPNAAFFPPSQCAAIAKGHYAAAINLSSNQEAASCMAQICAPYKWGAVGAAGGRYIHGYWHLYRAALTQNNHNNAFHWSDLYLLDVAPLKEIAGMYRLPQRKAGARRVGLVLGASSASKHPDAEFWIRLTRRLRHANVRPFFLGGTAEKELGAEVARKTGLPAANFCGRLSLKELGALLGTLDLCVTPDTGPMHLADYLGVPVLNLSMGPVHARETGPSSPGQWILRANMSCVGCWQCNRQHFYCKQAFHPQAVAHIIFTLLDTAASACSALKVPPGLQLLRTERNTLGLHTLVGAHEDHTCRFFLENFWQAAFLFLYDANNLPLLQQRWQQIYTAFPLLANKLAVALHKLCRCSAGHLEYKTPLPSDFWRTQPPIIRLFSGYMHMALQNTDYSPQGWQTAIEHLAALTRVCASA